jgi:hypothetical protein
VDREKREVEEASAAKAAAKVIMAKDMARHDADRGAARAAEKAAARACWDEALAEGQECRRQEDAPATIRRR